jgi:ubiquinone/menaquinone biosynthesis C-methylase UbiE
VARAEAAHGVADAVSAERYARWRATTLGRTTERLEREVVFDLAGPVVGKRVLDVGTGDGTYAIEAAARGGHVVGLDVSAANIAAARRRASERGVDVAFQRGRVECLPFADGAFDLVLAVTVLCFVEHPARAVAEMSRALAPGGRIVVGELARWTLWAALRRVRGWTTAPAWRRARFWSRRDLIRLLSTAGLEIQGVRGCVFYPPTGWAARLLSPLDRRLGRVSAPGAAFLAVAGKSCEVLCP